MNNTIEQYVKGNINLDLPEIILSETEILVSVEAGKSYSGTITITNDKKQQMKGVVFSSNRHIKIDEEQFIGESVTLNYTIEIKDYEALDTIEGSIAVISEFGEVEIPVKVTIVAASLQNENQAIKNLLQLTEIAKEDWAKAVAIFKAKEFEEVILSSESMRCREIYRNLLKGRSPSSALEEFLIAIHKKQPINLSLSKTSFTYEAIQDTISDKIIITKDLWGYTEIRVSTDVPFIELEHKILWTDNFVSNQYALQFQINPDKLREGENCGRIYIETALQSFVVQVMCNQRKELSQEVIDHRKFKGYTKEILENYLNFRLQKIEFDEYVTKSEEMIQSAQMIQNEEWLKLLECHLLMMKGERLKAKEMLEEYDEHLQELKKENPKIFCAIYYLKALVFQEEAMIQGANEVIRGMYALGHQDFMIFWFLIYMDKCYLGQNRLLLEDLKKQYEDGCNSPMMYFEVMTIFKNDAALITELDDFTVQAVNFGLKHDYITDDVMEQYIYLAGKERYYRPLVFQILEKMYEKNQSKELLTTICTTLIKGHMKNPYYFKWYKLGVEKQLRVTELQEYFMDTLDENSKEPLPQSILLYFIYNSRLSDKKRAYLYARVVKEKSENASIYHSYEKKIDQFALKQLEVGNINETLAVLYEDMLSSGRIPQEYYSYLAKLAYRTEIKCNNPNMTGVYVVHKELKGEKYAPIVEKSAIVDVLSDDVTFYFVDNKGQRYVASIAYETKRLLKETERLQELLYLSSSNLYQYVGYLAAEDAYHSYEETSVAICKQILELDEVKEEYRDAIIEQLIYYFNGYQNTDALDYYLKNICLEKMSKKSRDAITEICIQRENYDQVIDSINKYGYESLNPARLSKLCLRLIETKDKQISKEFLKFMSVQAFLNGNREEELIRYLAETYLGPTKRMKQIWQEANAKRIPCHEMEEQILAQTLFSKGDIKEVENVFLAYFKYASKANVSIAYLNFAAAHYLMTNEVPSEEILTCMKIEALDHKNLYCILALLKYFSALVNQIEDEDRECVSTLLENAVNSKVILPEFMALEEKVSLPSVMRNKTWIQYKSSTKKNVKLYYRILAKDDAKKDDFTSEVITPSILGIYVRSFVLFHNETLEYYFTEEGEKEDVMTVISKVQYKPSKKKYNSTFEQLNEMLMMSDRKEQNGQELSNMIEQYVKKEYIIQHYFRTI